MTHVQQPQYTDKPLHIPDPKQAGQFVFERDLEENVVYTNVPHLATHHSPDGFDFGYGGSGPADLALNIIEFVMRDIRPSGPRIVLWRGNCYRSTFALHQAFKWRFIAPVPRPGGYIEYEDVVAWIKSQMA